MCSFGADLHIACLQARPEQIAVAANDQFVRIYDRRMLSTGAHNCR